MSSAADVTLLLTAIHQGDTEARRRLFALVYDDLRAMAAAQMRPERNEHTLQATALVHEAYLRLFGHAETTCESRAHFFAIAAEAMRRILVDHARARLAAKRGGGRAREELADLSGPSDCDTDQILAIDEALSELERADLQRAQIVKLHFFSGLTFEQVAQVLGLSVRTVIRRWNYTRAWLFRRIGGV